MTRGPCPMPVAISYTRQILAALRYAHKNGIIHRDIKPHNVIVDREGRVKVADFGIARAGASEMTEAGSIVGTAQYLSPEQARGAPVDESSDLYSTGIVLYELLTGAVPFTGETPVEIAMKHLSQTPEAPSTIAARDPARSRPGRAAGPRQGAERPLPLRRRARPRSRARGTRRRGRGRDGDGRHDGPGRRWRARRHGGDARGGQAGAAWGRDVRRRRALPSLRRAGRPASQHLAVAPGSRRPGRRRSRRLVPLRQRAEADRQQQAAPRAAVHRHRREPRGQPDPGRWVRAQRSPAAER